MQREKNAQQIVKEKSRIFSRGKWFLISCNLHRAREREKQNKKKDVVRLFCVDKQCGTDAHESIAYSHANHSLPHSIHLRLIDSQLIFLIHTNPIIQLVFIS